MSKRTRTPKTGEYRTERVHLRLSPTEASIIDILRDKRTKYGYASSSRSDTIIACVKYATGTLDLFELENFNKSIRDLNEQVTTDKQ